MFVIGMLALITGAFTIGISSASPSEAASPATVTINYVSSSQCGSVTGTQNARVSSASLAQSDQLRECTAVFRVVR
jgi:hypothetical protein